MSTLTHSSIFIERLPVDASVGVFEWEKQALQTLEFDLECGYDFEAAIHSDDIEHAISYVSIAEHVKTVVTAQHYDLLEHLAGKLIDSLFNAFPPIQAITLQIGKPGAVPEAATVGVRIRAKRDTV